MEAKELRIGNFVTINNPNYHAVIKDVPMVIIGIVQRISSMIGSTYSINLEILDRELNMYYDSYSQYVEYIEPIPLTEEWLFKFGFKKWTDRKFVGRYTKNRHSVWYGVTDYQIKHSRPFRYVHQLQNIYFALTGEELTIK
jgi:hypothetical protein